MWAQQDLLIICGYKMAKNLHLVSLGCNKNLVDSEVMLGRLSHYKITDEPQNADVLIVNTCGFIGAAKQESLNTIFSLHEARKEGSLLVVAGCLTERYKEELTKELPEVDLFTGVGDYDSINEIIDKRQNRFTPRTYLQHNEKRLITGSTSHAYVKLSEGCNQKCSFCAIPGFKGKLQSRTIMQIVDEVNSLVKQGFYDFSFISQDSSSYGRDLNKKEGLIELIEQIEQIEGVKSARILYLYPTTTSDELIQKIINSPIFHNYFDMPIQHINDAMLKRMKRGAGAKRIKEQLSLMRASKESFLRTSIIVGHPGESEEEFEEVCEFLGIFDFDRVNIFAYSDEEDTSAFEMDKKVDGQIIQNRIEMVNAIVQDKTAKSLQNEVGKKVVCLLEGRSEEHEYLLSARKLLWAPEIDGEILINDSEVKNPQFGQIFEVNISEVVGDKLVGQIIKSL